METKDVTIALPLHAENFGQEIEAFLLAVDQALENGWQTTEDIPPLISSAVVNLVPAMQEFKLAQQDTKDDLYGAIKSITIHIINVVKAFATKGTVA